MKQFETIIDSLKGVHYGMYNKKLEKVLYSETEDGEINLFDYLEEHGDSEFIIMKPQDVIKYKAGTCWDTSLYIYSELKDKGYSPKMIFYVINQNDQEITHSTVVVRSQNGDLYNLEYSRNSKRGVHKINSPEDVYNDYPNKSISFHNHNMIVDKLLEMNEILVSDWISETGWKNKTIKESTIMELRHRPNRRFQQGFVLTESVESETSDKVKKIYQLAQFLSNDLVDDVSLKKLDLTDHTYGSKNYSAYIFVQYMYDEGFNVGLDWKCNNDDVVWMINRVAKKIGFDTIKLTTSRVIGDGEDAIKSASKVLKSLDYFLVDIDRDGDCYDLFIVHNNDKKAVCSILSSIGWKNTKLYDASEVVIIEASDTEDYSTEDDNNDDKKDSKEEKVPEEKSDEEPEQDKPEEDEPKDPPTEDKKPDEADQTDDDEGFPNVPQYMQDRMGDNDSNVEDFEMPGDDASIGNDTEGQQNDYNQKDIEILNKSIAEELTSNKSHSDNILLVSSDILRKLYADIGNEERFHAEQLLYAKSIITGEKYEPQDPDVKAEYEELVSGGMEEGDALNTVADRMRLTAGSKAVDDPDDEPLSFDFEGLDEQFSLLEQAMEHKIILYDYICEMYSKEKVDNQLDIIMEAFINGSEISYMEATQIARPNDTFKANPFKMLFDLIKGIWTFATRLIHMIKRAIAKAGLKMDNIRFMIKKHGLGYFFKEGVSLYFWDTKKNQPATAEIYSYSHLLHAMTSDVLNFFHPGDGAVNTQAIATCEAAATKYGGKIHYTKGNPKRGFDTLKNITFTKSRVVIDTQEAENKVVAHIFSLEPNSVLTHLRGVSEMLLNLTTILKDSIDKAQQETDKYTTHKEMDKFHQNIAYARELIRGNGNILKYITSDIKSILGLFDRINTQTPEGQRATTSVQAHHTNDAQNQLNRNAQGNRGMNPNIH